MPTDNADFNEGNACVLSMGRSTINDKEMWRTSTIDIVKVLHSHAGVKQVKKIIKCSNGLDY